MTDSGVTLINPFELSTATADELVESWREMAEHMSSAPGFRDTRLHRAVQSDARFPIVNVAHWDSGEQLAAALATAQAQGAASKTRNGFRADPAIYRIVHDFAPPTARATEGPGVTFMNIFEIAPDEVDAFAENWSERAQLMRTAPGFRDVQLHRALRPDARFQLVNVAHWDNIEVWRAATQNATMVAATKAARSHATPNTAIYEVIIELS